MDRIEIFETVINAIPLPAVIIGGSKRILAMNDASVRLLALNAKGAHYTSVLRQPAATAAIDRSLSDGQARDIRVALRDEGRDASWRLDIRPLAVPQSSGLMVVFQDISCAEVLVQMRRDFVANVSHELRTPLTALMGFIETLRGPARNDPKAAERFLDIMQDEAERMNRLVGDLMSLNRVEGAERVRPTETVVLNDVLDSTLRTLRSLASEAGVEINRDFGDAPVALTGDADQLKQVFTNLIENAIKYGGSGGRVAVRMTTSAREPALRAPGVRVQITDNGPGIDTVHLPRITERFYRADDHRSRALGGTGLGLAIVKHIINRHRGRLRVESVLGEGAIFTVILPTPDNSGLT